jgi:glucosamine--fructose-6-phosphate aminotransferase (isomerizing)
MNDILNEPDELLKSLEYSLGPGRGAMEDAAKIVNGSRNVFLSGIGSSWHAGMAIQSLFSAAGRHIPLIESSVMLYHPTLPPDSALVLLSRSGRSVEIVRQVEMAKASGAKVIGITNTPDSPLAKAATVTLPMNAAFDHNVSVTMYSALTLVGGLLATFATGGDADALATELRGALSATKAKMEEWRAKAESSEWLAANAPTYFLARGGAAASCHEARLLWEEAAKAPASAMTTGGFRHGPQEMLREGVRVGLWLDGEKLRQEDLALASDLRRHGAKTLLIGQNVPSDAADLTFDLPAIPAAWQFLTEIVPAQIVAERLARLRGEDCDEFRICPYIIESESGL